MSKSFQYDVFLSHNSADKPRVRELAGRVQVPAFFSIFGKMLSILLTHV